MTFLPIVERELRLKARRPRTYGFRCGMVLAFAVISFGILAVDWSAGQNPTVMGQHLFWTLSGLAFACALMAGPVVTADCLCDEKREGTLGLLFLTDLKGHDVVLGKLAATSLRGFYGLLAVVPVLAVPLLMGGITNGEFWRMVLVLVDTFLLSLAIGMLGSALSRDFRRAMAANFALLLVFLGLLPACATVIAYLHPSHQLIPELFFSCPAYAFYLCSDARYGMKPTHFWWSVGMLHGLTWLLILLASWIVPWTWQDRPSRGGGGRGWRQLWHRWSYGGP